MQQTVPTWRQKGALLLLALLMLLTFVLLPQPAQAEENGVTVYVSVLDMTNSRTPGFQVDKNYENLMYRVPVTVSNTDLSGYNITGYTYDSSAAPNLLHVIEKVHELYCKDGTDAFTYTASGMMTKIWGVETLNLGYRLNSQYTNYAHKVSVSDGDDIDIYTYGSAAYSYFDQRTATIKAGEALTLTLKQTGGMGSSGSSVSGAQIMVADPDSGYFLGAEEDDYFYNWRTDSNGQVTISFAEPGTYRLTAYTNSYGNSSIVWPVCEVTVTEGVSEDERQQTVAADKLALLLNGADNTATIDVTDNLTLPTKGESGKTTISWSSNNTAAVSNSGVVTRAATEQTATLTATISYGTVADSKEFSLRIPALTTEEMLTAAKNVLNNLKLHQWNDAGTAYQDTNLLTVAQAAVDAAVSGVTISLTDVSQHSQIAADGTITYPLGTDEYGYKDEPVTDNVSFGLLVDGTHSDTVTVAITVPENLRSKQQVMDEAASADFLFNLIKEDNTAMDNITSGVKITSGGTQTDNYCVDIKWSSSNTNVIGNSGSVTRPAYGEEPVEVKLTATLSWYSGYDWMAKYGMAEPTVGAMPANRTVELTLTVQPYTEQEIEAAKPGVEAELGKITAEMFKESGASGKDDPAADLSNVTYDLQLPSSSSGYSDTWSSNNEAITINYLRGKVNRPGIGENDVTGISLTITITKDGYSASKTFDNITVKAVTQEEVDAETAAMQAAMTAFFDGIKEDNIDPDHITGPLTNAYHVTYNQTGDGYDFVWYTKAQSLNKGFKIDGYQSSNFAVIGEGGSYWQETPSNIYINFVNPPATQPAKVKISATFSSVRLADYIQPQTAEIEVTVLPEQIIQQLINNIAARFTPNNVDINNYAWLIADLTAYASLYPDSEHQLSNEAIQNYLNYAIAEIDETTTASDVARHIIGLKALGYDAMQLTTASGNSLNAAQKLTGMLDSVLEDQYGIYSLPYILIALQQDANYASQSDLDKIVDAILAERIDGAGWGYDVTEADATAPILLALSPYYNSNPAVKTAVDDAVAALKTLQGDSGAIDVPNWTTQVLEPNANSTGITIAGLTAVGIDPSTVINASGKSLLDGLAVLATYEMDGFLYDGGFNMLATEQGFRGLIAAAGYQANGYNIYDFSNKPANPGSATLTTYTATFVIKDSEGNRVTKDASLTVRNGEGTKMRATESGVYELPAGSYSYNVKYADHLDKSGSFTISAADRTITIELELEGIEVSFRLIGDDKHGSSGHDSYLTWYATRDYLVAEDSTVWDLAVTAFDQAGLSYTWKKGYLSAVESPLTGIKLAEKDNGTASGWMYTVNGKSPNKGMGDYYLEEGDEVIVYFTDDYSTRYTGFSVRDADPSKATLKAALAVLIDEAEELLDNVAISADGADIAANQYWVDQQAYTALEKALATAEKAYKNAETFDDYQEAISDLAQAIEKFGEEMSYGLLAVTAHFSDVPTTHWAFEHIEYLYSQGLITGKTTTLFAPEAPITRAEVITILARMSGENLAGYNSGFSDVAANAYYAGAVTWGVRAGITNGTTATTFSPNEPITREQIAAMIYRYAEYRGYNFTYTQSAINFTDQSNISAYAFNAVYSMQRAGIIDGYANGAWLPQGYASRAEAAKMLALAQQMFSASVSSYLYAA